MSSFLKFTVVLVCFALVNFSCKKDPETDPVIKGCRDAQADNYNANATVDEGNCYFQKRFISAYNVNILCGAASAVFKDATLDITENTKKDRVNFNIGSIAGSIIFDGVITKNTVNIDTTILGLIVNAKNLDPNYPDVEVKANVSMKSLLTLSDDSKKLAGNMKVGLVTTEPFTINGIEIPAGFPVNDDCTFEGVKK
ncbi:MAG: hypothetical protein KBF69_06945 [Saprospiraceae bacterium]|nr:hypothetical protein [Saprospiraceae bacterium]